MPVLTLPEIIEKQEQQAVEGPLYDVIIHNDDVTPMDFVVTILLSIFQLAGIRAAQVMYTAHHNGSAYVQTLPKAEAVRRVGLAHMSARLNKYPLEFTIQPQKARQ
jgi:ATP-dependent Clp protease adaptor protein ClpS